MDQVTGDPVAAPATEIQLGTCRYGTSEDRPHFVRLWGAFLRELRELGSSVLPNEKNLYTFWDYQAGAWQKNWGIRIDHMLLSPQAADCLTGAAIDKHVRGWERPSDHVPVVVELAVD